MNKRILIFLLISIHIGFCYSQGTWNQKANFPGIGREVPVSFAIGNKGYTGCGYSGGPVQNDLWEYDPATNMWTQKASLPANGRYGATGFAINNKGYVGCGFDGSDYNDFWEYDPALNSWTQKANFGGIARGFAVGFAIGNKGYIGCGGVAGTLNDFWEWDQSTNVWTKKNNFPGLPRGYAPGYAINGKGYFCTGYNNGSVLNDNWEYDPSTDIWTQKASLPAAGRIDASAFAICNKGYLGTGGESPYYKDFWQYDPALNLWTQMANIPTTNRDDASYFAIGNKGYLGLGQFLGSTYALDFWEFTPDSNFLCGTVPSAGFTSSDTAFCGEAGKCIDFTDLSTGNPTSWKWFFPGAIPDTSTQQNPTGICYYNVGTYAVTLIASSSGGSDTLTVSPMIVFAPSPPPPILTLSGDTVYCSHASSYQWYFNGSPIPGATDSFYVVTLCGVYNVYITDNLGCSRLSNSFGSPCGVNELSSQSIQVFPNPVSDQFTVYGLEFTQSTVLQVYTILGEKVFTGVLNNKQETVDCKPFPPGIYIVEVRNGDKAYRTKFVKE